jgi:FtsP/CotA-like multicopper oxidase with cupredoxin domain
LSVSRRQFLASATLALLPVTVRAAEPYPLISQPGVASILGSDKPATEAWTYAGRVPGPEIRVRQGDRLQVHFTNRLDVATTVHWHGIRLPNEMDGVPYVTQPPVEPGASFFYEFDLTDAGTFWYHPHIQSSEQVGRGLYGPLIVEEREPVRVDRELVWMLDDWRMSLDGQLAGGFDDFYDRSHEGRIGDRVTVNGVVPTEEPVRAGERIRLRLVNVANARYFGLRFTDHDPIVIALDGQPCEPHQPADRRVVLGPAMRADVILDMGAAPSGRYPVVDDYYKNATFNLLDLVYDDGTPIRDDPLDAPIVLPANPLLQPNLGTAVRHMVILEGGSGGSMAGANLEGQLLGLTQLADHGKAWALNGEVSSGHRMPPLLGAKQGQSVIIEMRNETYYPHPMHLHGHSFRVLKRDGEPVPNTIWRDTVNVKRNETVQVAFVADNPGDWMFHCHILEHQEAGMMGIFRVS